MDLEVLYFFSDELEKLAADALTRRLMSGRLPKLRESADALRKAARTPGTGTKALDRAEGSMPSIALKAIRKAEAGKALRSKGGGAGGWRREGAELTGKNYRREQGILSKPKVVNDGRTVVTPNYAKPGGGSHMSRPAYERYGRQPPRNR